MSEKESDLNATLIRPRLKCYDLASGIFGAAGRYFILWDIVDPRTESNPNPNPEPNPHPNPEPNSNHNPNPDPNCGLYPIR